MIKFLKKLFYIDTNIYKDWRFWLIFIILNMSGNHGFYLIVKEQLFVSLMFIFTTTYVIIKHLIKTKHIIFISLFALILLIQSGYCSSYLINSQIHFAMKIIIGINGVLIAGNKFIKYFTQSIVIFAIISLVCFTLNSIGIIIPFISVSSTSLDSGRILRVYSIIYTQLYNPEYGSLTLRNCGPFWEPGAFQGFLNLALLFLILKDYRLRPYPVIILLIITIITTYSTGGYIVLFMNIMLLLKTEHRLPPISKIAFVLLFFGISYMYYHNLDFMSEKIRTGGDGRFSFTIDDIGGDIYALFGYGLSVESFNESSIKVISSVFNLIRYCGVVGFIVYFSYIFYTIKDLKSLYVVIVFCLIFTNEPFITAGPFWWGAPFFIPYANTKYIKN